MPLYNPYICLNSNSPIGKSKNLSTLAHAGVGYLIGKDIEQHFIMDFSPGIEGVIFQNDKVSFSLFAGPEIIWIFPNFDFGIQTGLGVQLGRLEIRWINNLIMNSLYKIYWPNVSLNFPI